MDGLLAFAPLTGLHAAVSPQHIQLSVTSRALPSNDTNFLGSMPLLNEIPYELDDRAHGFNSPPRHSEQMTFYYRRNDVVAYSFIQDRSEKEYVPKLGGPISAAVTRARAELSSASARNSLKSSTLKPDSQLGIVAAICGH